MTVNWNWPLGVALAALLSGAPAHAAEAPLAGCYKRVYDAAHLAAHRGQIVARATLSIAPVAAQAQLDKTHLVNASLKLGLRGRKMSFDSLGACRLEGENLICNGSLSAAEADACKDKADGVHACRIDSSDPGAFQIAAAPEGVKVTIRQRLELVPPPYDGGPFLYLSPNNPENHALLLKPAAASECR